MLAEERTRLHPLPAHPYTAAFGGPHRAGEHADGGLRALSYSVPHTLMGETAWVRPYRDEVVIVYVGDHGPVEVARHARTTPGNARRRRAFPAAGWGVPCARKLLRRNGFWPSVMARCCG